MIEPVVMAPGPSSSHIGCFTRTSGDSWIRRLVSYRMPMCCTVWGYSSPLHVSLRPPLVGLGCLSASNAFVGRYPCMFWAFRPPSDITRCVALVSQILLCGGFRCLFRLLEALPSSMVMWLIGLKSDLQVGLMAICSCYDKTYIVIPTCRSDGPSCPPHSGKVALLNRGYLGV